MTLRLFQAPPKPVVKVAWKPVAMVCAGPPDVSNFFNAPSMTAARYRLSGDQKYRCAPSLPESGVVVPASKDHSQIRSSVAGPSVVPRVWIAARRPSGEMVMFGREGGMTVEGSCGLIRNRGDSAGVARAVHAATAIAIAATVVTTAVAGQIHFLASRRAGSIVRSGSGLTRSSQSPMWRSRFLGSFSRHFFRRPTMGAGIASQFGSRASTDARASVTSSPPKARFAVTIS